MRLADKSDPSKKPATSCFYQAPCIVGGENVFSCPGRGTANVHELDKADDDARVSKVPRDRQDLVLVHAPLDNGINLYRRQTCRRCCLNAFQDPCNRETDVVHPLKYGI